ncbi:MAG: c-type cytochrome [Luteolibacter sp.]
MMLRTTLASLALTTTLPAATQIFQAFEGDGFDDWKVEGTAFGLAPVAERTQEMKEAFTAYSNDYLAASTHGGDAAKGSLTSPEFTIAEPYITFLIAGGDYAGKTAAQLMIDGKVVRESTGKRSLRCETAVWSVAEFKGRKAQIRLIDDEAGENGFIAVDQITFTDYPNQKFPPTTREGKPLVQGLALTKVVAGVNIPEGSILKIEATYKDQKITSPTAITFDEQGRVYVAETHRFRAGVEDDRGNLYWYLDDLASKTTKDRSAMYEKWKAKITPEYLTAKSEVIRRLADTNGDGKLDESKVFADGFKDALDGTAAGVFYYEGSLYFACIPKIWMLRDTNGDGVADERKVVEEGFGVRVSLSGHDLNGFTLGPDGRIWGTVGDRGLSMVTKEGVKYDFPDQGAVFRFEPDGTGFELYHTGLRNPKEIAFDALGNAFSVDNNSDQGDAARVVYIVEGGDSGWEMEHQAMHSFHRQIGLDQRPPSRWMDERMWEMENPVQPSYMLPPSAYLTSGPSGLTYNPGVGFQEKEDNHFLVCDYRGGAANSGIWSFEMKPKGAGMEMSDSRQFAWGIAATDVEYSWDGRIFISDFVTGWASHEDGRLLSLDGGEKAWRAADAASTAKIIREGFEHRSAGELANLLKHPDARVRLRAQVALTRKPDALQRFSDATASSNTMVRIHSIWGLGILSRRGSSPLPVTGFGDVPTVKIRTEAEKKLISLLQDKDAEIRAQVLRTLADTQSITTVQVGPLLADPSPRVRFFAAILAGKRKMIGFYGPICDMLRENNNSDVYLRHAGAFALQHMAPDSRTISALSHDESAAVRLAAVIALRRLNSPDLTAFIRDADPKVADEAIRAICDLNLVGQRPAVAMLLDDLGKREWTPFMLRRLIHNSFRIGTAEDATRVLKFAASPQNPDRERQEALRLISLWINPPPADQLTGHFSPLEKRDPEIIRPVLTAALPELLRQDGFVLTSALGLIGQYHVDIAGLDETTLRTLTRNAALPAAARANALGLYVDRKPKDLTAVLVELAADASDEVALTALSNLAKLSPATAIAPLETAISSGKVARVQQSWKILATLPGDKVDVIFVKSLDQLRESNGVAPHAIELIEGAKQRSGTSVAAALATLEKSLAESKDPLAKWNIALEGGDWKNGEAIFTSHPASECMRCHRAEEGHAAGGETAPNLYGVAKRHTDRRYFLESMVTPSAVIAPGFGTVLINFKNGATLSGNVIAETPDHLDLDAIGKSLRIKRSDIESVTQPVSPMPPMADLLNPGELRDLVAWIATLAKDNNRPQTVATPEPLDPNTLEVPKVSAAAAAVDPAVLKAGQQQFLICGACHGQGGEGTAIAPPLAGSEWVNGPAENFIRIQLRGLHGPIKVKGQEYNMPAGMAALAYQTDDQIAAVLTYIRTSFGNSAPAVAPAEVAALRSEVGKPQLNATDLKAPVPSAPKEEPKPSEKSGTVPPATSQTTPPSASDKYAHLTPESGSGKWAAIIVGIIAAMCVIPVMKRK